MHTMITRTAIPFVLFVVMLAGQPALPLDSNIFDRLEFRSIGPAIMGGRTADIEGVPGNPNLVYAATGSGVCGRPSTGG